MQASFEKFNPPFVAFSFYYRDMGVLYENLGLLNSSKLNKLCFIERVVATAQNPEAFLSM